MPRIEDLHKLLAADPNDPFVLYAIAQEHGKLGQTREAIEFYDRCLAADPTYHYAYFHKARVLEAAGDLATATATLKAGIASARAKADHKAWNEMQGYLDELEP
jgi:tetratricopeptide (TPR) repeat protein